jgi:hypothetical protein
MCDRMAEVTRNLFYGRTPEILGKDGFCGYSMM